MFYLDFLYFLNSFSKPSPHLIYVFVGLKVVKFKHTGISIKENMKPVCSLKISCLTDIKGS